MKGGKTCVVKGDYLDGFTINISDAEIVVKPNDGIGKKLLDDARAQWSLDALKGGGNELHD
jgi:hypothetical protein